MQLAWNYMICYMAFLLNSEHCVSPSLPIPHIRRVVGGAKLILDKQKGKGRKDGLVKKGRAYLCLSEKTEKHWLYFGRHNGGQGKGINPAQCPQTLIPLFFIIISVKHFQVLAGGQGIWVINNDILLPHLSQNYLSICSQLFHSSVQISTINICFGPLIGTLPVH